MRQTFSATGPGARRGLGALLLLVLPVLLHAALAPWPHSPPVRRSNRPSGKPWADWFTALAIQGRVLAKSSSFPGSSTYMGSVGR